MSNLDALLEVQERDTAADRLRHRRANLPERAEIVTLEERLAALEARRAETGASLDAVALRQSRLEEEVRFLDGRIEEIERRLYSGTVTASRDLQAMSTEVSSLRARRSSVEDEVLVTMEQGEPLARQLEELDREREAIDAEAGRLRATLVASEVEIDHEISGEEEARAMAAQGVPSDLLRTYEGLRTKLGGVGAARLVGSTCTGCHLALPSAEVARIKREPADALVYCDQCGRILVR